MRSTDERMDAVKVRTAQIKRKQNILKRNILTVSSVLTSVLLVVGVAGAMPSIVSRIFDSEYIVQNAAGSVFSAGNAVGYVVIGLIAFVLGILVNILCTHLRNKNRNDKNND